jgi:membrane protein
MGKAREWAEARSHRIRGHNPWLVAVCVVRRFGEVRVTGLGAEMAYYALVSTIPLVATLGAAMGTFKRLIGSARVRELEDLLISSLERVFSADLTVTVIEPLVRGLLAEERTGFALGGLVITLWFAGGAFRAAIRALDDAYKVPERRSALSQWAVAYGLTVGAVVGLVVLLSLVVVGPLLGGGHIIAAWLRLGTAFELAWATLRWVVVAGAGGAYLVWLYRIAPNVKNGWRDCLPGAVLAGVGIPHGGRGGSGHLEIDAEGQGDQEDADAAVQVVSQTIGAILAAVLWVWLISCAVLTGGVLNAELDASRGIRRERKV